MTDNTDDMAVLGPEELREISREVARLQELGAALQEVGLHAAGDRIMLACRRISDRLNWGTLDAPERDGLTDPEAVHALR